MLLAMAEARPFWIANAVYLAFTLSARRALTPRGTLVIVGGEGGKWLGGVQRVFRAALLNPFVRHRLRGLVSRVRGADLEVLRETIEAGRVTPLLDRTYPLSGAAAAIEYVHKGHSAGKVVLTL